MIKYTEKSYIKDFPPPLPKPEEEERWRRFFKGDTQARDDLVIHNMRLVGWISCRFAAAFNFTGGNCFIEELDDLVSIGAIGLINAVETFDPDKAVFATYARTCIENQIKMHFNNLKKHQNVQSFDAPNEEGLPLKNTLSDNTDFTEEIDNKIALQNAILTTRLSTTEKEVLAMRFGNKRLKQQAIADKLHLSQRGVSLAEERVISKLKKSIFAPSTEKAKLSIHP